MRMKILEYANAEMGYCVILIVAVSAFLGFPLEDATASGDAGRAVAVAE
jgi:hypothetical protein